MVHDINPEHQLLVGRNPGKKLVSDRLSWFWLTKIGQLIGFGHKSCKMIGVELNSGQSSGKNNNNNNNVEIVGSEQKFRPLFVLRTNILSKF